MSFVLRDGFGTESRTAVDFGSGPYEMLFGKEKD